MNPRDRIRLAMKLQHPDRVPLMCQFSFGFINQQLKNTGISPMEVWLDAHKYVEGLLLLRERFNFDGILVSVHGHHENWRSKIKNMEIRHGVQVAAFHDRIEAYPDDDLPTASFFNKKSVDIHGMDIDLLPDEIEFIPASKDCHGFIDKKNPFLVFDILDEKVKGKYSIHGEVTSPFDYLLDLLGYENALLALLTAPEKCKSLLQHYTDGIIRLLDGMCTKNIDAVKISSPFAGMGFISPEQYIEFEQPFIKQIAGTITKYDKFSYIHTCGHISDRLEDMCAAGIHGLECLDPPPIGNVNLKIAFDRIGSTQFIKGNIDPVTTLLHGSKSSITGDIIKRLKIGMKNPGFILSSACSIAPKTPAENIHLLYELVEEHGYYN